jgi:hypothetical protein
MRAGGAEWVVHRFAVLQYVVFAVMVPGSVVAVAARAMRDELAGARTPPSWGVFRAALGVTCIFAGAHFATLRSPYNWGSYLDRTRLGAEKRLDRELRPITRLAADLRTHVPAGAVVLAEPSVGMRAVMAHDCVIVASASSSNGVPDLGERTRAVKKMLLTRTPDEEREELLARYGVTHLLLKRPAKRWVYERMSEFWATEYGWCIIGLREPGDESTVVRGDFDQALLDIGEYRRAIPWLRDRIARDPAHFGRRLRLGNALMKTGRHDEAIEAYARAAELRPRDPRPIIMIGNAHAATACYDDAIDAYHRTLSLAEEAGRPDVAASAWFNIGNTHYRLGAWDDAIDAYRLALDASPGHGDARYWRDQARENRRLRAPPPDPIAGPRPAEDEGEETTATPPPGDDRISDDDTAPADDQE